MKEVCDVFTCLLTSAADADAEEELSSTAAVGPAPQQYCRSELRKMGQVTQPTYCCTRTHTLNYRSSTKVLTRTSNSGGRGMWQSAQQRDFVGLWTRFAGF